MRQLSLVIYHPTRLCSLTLLTVGTTRLPVRPLQQGTHTSPENHKLALATCINKLCRVPRGEGWPGTWVHSAASTPSSFQRSSTTTTTNQDELRGVVNSHLPQGKKNKTNKPKSNCILQIPGPIFLTTWLTFQADTLESFVTGKFSHLSGTMHLLGYSSEPYKHPSSSSPLCKTF